MKNLPLSALVALVVVVVATAFMYLQELTPQRGNQSSAGLRRFRA
jgi:hypothetical protein